MRFPYLGPVMVSSILTLTGSAIATPVTWTLRDVTFSDGGLARGSFVYDAESHVFSDVLIETTGGLQFTYNTIVAANSFAVDFNTGAADVGTGFLQITARNATFSNEGGTIAIGRNQFDPSMYSWETVYRQYDFGVSHGPVVRDIIRGELVSSIPEPGTHLLAFLAIFAMMSLGSRRAMSTS